MFDTNPENTAAIERMVAILSELPAGGMASYSALSAAAGRDVTNGHRHLLSAAREAVEKQLGCLFEAVRAEGIKRLQSENIPDAGAQAIRKIGRAARRGSKRLGRANPNSLPDAEARRLSAYKAALGAIAIVADNRKVKALAAVADVVKPIPPANVLDMFRR